MHVARGVLHAREEVVVAKERRDRDGQAGDGGEQRGGDAGRDGVDVHVARRGHRGEGDHHADHRAEQPEERAARNGRS